MAFNAKKEYASLKARTDKYATDISKIYSSAVNELLKLIPTEAGEEFSFDDNPRIAKKASDILRRMQAAAETAIRKDIKLEWALGNKAADEFLSTMFGKKVLNDPRFAGWTKRNGDALNAFMESHAGGMALSDRIWKTAEQLRDEMQLAVSVSIGSGKSASTISREVRQYLKYPDKLFRRVKIGTNPDGTPKYRLSEAAKAFHSGKGVYRSSYKNAMRLARTETNAAYRTADSERWRQMDFVTGIRISLSHSHPMPDICDELAGDYPKDFIFTGWHPQCFCYATPITISQDKFVEMQKAKLAGDSYDTSAEQITDMPDKFNEWCERNKGRIAEAQKNGTLPYFLKDNPEKLKEALSASQLKEALKTEEYRLGKEALARMQQIPDYDTAAMQKALKSGDLEAIKAETDKYAQVKEQLSNLTYIDNGFDEAKKWGMKTILKIEENVEGKIEFFSGSYSLEEQAKKLKFEAIDFLGGNMKHPKTGIPVQEMFPTWQLTQNAYLKQLAIVNDKIEWQQLDKTLKELQMFSGGSGYDALYMKASNAFVLKNKELVKATISEMEEFKSIVGDAEVLYGKFASKTKPQAIAKLDDAIESALEQGNMTEAKKAISELNEWAMVDDAWGTASKVFDGADSKLSKMLKAAYSDALESGNMVQAKSALQETGKWQELIPAFKEAAAFKSKSAEYNKLVAELGDAIDAGDSVLAKKKADAVAQKRALLDKKYGKGKKGKNEIVFGGECFTEERKNDAIWAMTAEGADNEFFDNAVKSWAAAADNERRALYHYTVGSGYLTKPLRGIKGWYYDYSPELTRSMQDAELITEYIKRSTLSRDAWVVRNERAAFTNYKFGVDLDELRHSGRLQELVGKTGVDESFLSCGSYRNAEFTGTGGDNKFGRCKVKLNIYCPKGTQMTYSEPINNYGQYSGFRWDGKSKLTDFNEAEVTMQRGTKFRVLKVEWKAAEDRYFIDVEVIGQNPRKIKEMKWFDEEGGYKAVFED